MQCPMCGRPSAPNAMEGDRRCGPCHNFRIVRFEGPYAVILELDFEKWLSGTRDAIADANNLETYQPWLDALKRSHDARVQRWIEGKDLDSQ